MDLEIQKPPAMSEKAYVREAADAEKMKKSAAERKLVWKADLTILPLAGLIYLVAYLVSRLTLHSFLVSATPHRCSRLTMGHCFIQDRNSIGLANVMGMSKDLGMTSGQYYNCLMMFCRCQTPRIFFTITSCQFQELTLLTQISAISSSCSQETSGSEFSLPITSWEDVRFFSERS
jgi:hypothetical protein